MSQEAETITLPAKPGLGDGLPEWVTRFQNPQADQTTWEAQESRQAYQNTDAYLRGAIQRLVGLLEGLEHGPHSDTAFQNATGSVAAAAYSAGRLRAMAEASAHRRFVDVRKES